ncbi:MAG: class I SAM-dependent methyltransferase [Deltaproteobacteria bacterium]|nr:MAG: class I SAM-dependent methyltransferase [Deltaproteobacteria bacterium]
MTQEKNLGWSAAEYSELVGFDGDWRDTWWHQDYLELVARRLDLASVGTVLDVGCGVGHWGQRLATVMSADVEVIGVDHEAGFLDAARARAETRPGRHTYLHATGETLPFEDGRFDLVTCQTVLIHVADARAVLREMLRVTRPGGLVLLSEPNNLVDPVSNRIALGGLEDGELARLFAFEATCIRGRAALGEGDAVVGERMGGYLHELGCVDLRTWTNDTCAPMYPPYDSPVARLHADAMQRWASQGVGSFGPRERTLAMYRAGGGDEDRFEPLWQAAVKSLADVAAGIAAGRFRGPGGFMMYLVAGRKPG